MKIEITEEKIVELLLKCLQDVPAVRNLNYILNKTDSLPGPVIEVETERETYRIIFEISNNGQPRYARYAVARLFLKASNSGENIYPVFAAPYISESAAQICLQTGSGFMDLAGNCRLAFDGIYIERTGCPNPYVSKRLLQSLYRTRSSRILRALLFDPSLKWKLADLSTAAGTSIGQVFNVKKALIDREWAEFDKEGLSLTRPAQLLRDWGKHYTYRKNTLFAFYSSDTPAEIESSLVRYLTEQGVRCAMTAFSAVARFSQVAQNNHVFVYVDAATEADIHQTAERLKLRTVAAGSNVNLMIPYDDGVLFGMNERQGANVVSPIQAYLDLTGIEETGAEMAESFLSRVIQKEWQSGVDPSPR